MDTVKSPLLDHSLLFKGESDNPLLAPRGVWLHNDLLVVADTGQNRVFLWQGLPTSPFVKPAVVLGQQASQDTGRNAGGVSASSLQYPSGVWTDGRRLAVADAWNHRVLLWHELPTQDGQAADVVIGQPDFDHNEPNVKGIGSPPAANTLHWPYGLHSDGEQLWIADTGNRRVLHFARWPEHNGAHADGVIGKDSFETRDYESEDPVWPYSVRIGPGGAMAITDTQYYRVLLWDQWQDGFRRKADQIIGQADLQSNGQNQYMLQPDAHTLSWCYDSFFDEQGLWVVDTGNSRLLRFSPLPEQHNVSASTVLGPPDFLTGSDNANTIGGTENALYWPFAICINQQHLVIADTGNHRIIISQLDQL